MNKKILFVVCIILLPILIFAGSDQDEAMSLYFSGKDSYNSGNYFDAQRYFHSALIKNPDIEAKAPNIKYMLGVSAFNNDDYKTAKTYLYLFTGNPIADDLLKKIDEHEATLPEGFLYYNDMEEKFTNDASKSALQTASSTVTEESGNTLTPIILLSAVSVLIIAIGLFIEIKINTFSKLALKLVGVSPDILNGQHNVTKPVDSDVSEEDSAVETETEEAIEINDKVLLDTPFDEEINIEEMASKDIRELSKFFGDDEPLFEETPTEETVEVERDVSVNFEENITDEFDDARSSILNAVLDEDESESSEENELRENNIASYTPKYEHLDNIPDDFDVNSAISKAYELIESMDSEEVDEDTSEQWVSIDEYSDSLDEEESFNVNYFQNIEEMDDEDLNKYYNYIFAKHNKEKVK